MTTVEFLSYLRGLDVRIWVDGEQLRVKALKGTLSSELKKELSQRKGEIIQILNESTTISVGETIQPVSRDGELPLSFAQERLWLLDQLEPGSMAYNIPIALRLSGRVDLGVLVRALSEIRRRHEVLRTTFRSAEDRPVQVISPRWEVEVPVIDLGYIPEGERGGEARWLCNEEARRPFDLSQGPLIRCFLMKIGEADYVLLLVIHHIVFDGWSMGVFIKELSILYEVYSLGKSSPFPELPIQYADFACWQKEWFNGEVLQSQLNYWKDKLKGELPTLQLPTDRPRPAVQSYKGALQTFSLSKNLSEALILFSRREDVTLFMTLLAVFKIFLYRYTGEKDLIVGTPIANRNRREIECLIGFFLNTLALRTDISGNQSFREFLGRVRTAALGAYEHQDIPFEKLIEELQPVRSMSNSPIFQVMFILQNAPTESINLPGLGISQFEIDPGTSKFDLSLVMWETSNGICGFADYNTDLFDAETITRMLRHYETLLGEAVSQPDRRLSSIPMVSETERSQLSLHNNLIRPTDSYTVFQKSAISQTIQARLERQVRISPRNIAVRTSKYEWSYEELNGRANKIAYDILGHLSKANDGKGTEIIALLIEHEAPMIAGIFGVLKAGMTYVPLDPAYPVERLKYMLEDSNACAIITNSANFTLAESIKNDNVKLINIDGGDPGFAERDNPAPSPTPDKLAYILYTSGSTGQPKGIMQNHRNVLHFIREYTNNLHINNTDRMTLLSSYGFDAAVMDIYGALLNGATLYPIDIRETGITALIQCLTQQGITIYHSTPTVYRYLMSSLTGGENFSSIRLVVLGGEAVNKRDAELFKKYFNEDCIFINGLGPTESTVSLQYFLNKQTSVSRNAVPVGYPVEDTEILLLNEDGENSEIYGEIAIRSSYVAIGYWNKPEITAKVFLPDPEGGDRRIYRTGDMGRLLSDGSIEFIGRKDFQVKIRGFRIELREIETKLLEYPEIEDVIVTVKRGNQGENHLAAFIVSSNGKSLRVGKLRRFLQDKIPDYMVPSYFLLVEAFPLTPTGKVDQRALTEIQGEFIENKEISLEPQSQMERMLVNIWTSVLQVDRIGVDDNFFDLGGHSLLATQLISRVRDKLGVNLPLRTVFEHPTISNLSTQIEEILLSREK